MNTSTFSFSILLIFLLTGCDEPLFNRNDLNTPNQLIYEFSASPVFDQLQRSYSGINISEAAVVEFNQNRVILLPIHSNMDLAGRGDGTQEGIIVKVNANSSFLGLVKVKITGSSGEVDSRFSGEIAIVYLTGKQGVSGSFSQGNLIRTERIGSASARTTSDCPEVCPLLECVSDKISQAGFIERLICGFDPIQCLTVIMVECLFLDEARNVLI